jgi:hypothetical protein
MIRTATIMLKSGSILQRDQLPNGGTRLIIKLSKSEQEKLGADVISITRGPEEPIIELYMKLKVSVDDCEPSPQLRTRALQDTFNERGCGRATNPNEWPDDLPQPINHH